MMGRPHRYSYNMSLGNEPTLLFDGLVRFDSATGAKQEHKFGPGRWGAEAPFAPRDGSTSETDGRLRPAGTSIAATARSVRLPRLPGTR